MNEKLKQLRKVHAENCVTLILNTHRTAPDNQQDGIKLKNLAKKAEEKLNETTDKKTASATIEKMNSVIGQIDHNYNLESLLVFVNAEQNIAEYVRLPIAVSDRAVVSNSFATRDMLRAQQLTSNYYVLVLSQQKTRLLEANNDQLLKEFGDPFPMENTDLHPTSAAEASNASRQTNLIAEYFNRVDKAVNEIRTTNPQPVFIATEESNFYEYLKVADEKESIFETYLNGNHQDGKGADVVREAWKMVKNEVEKRNNERRKNLEEAVDAGRFLSDVNEVRLAVKEGRVATLYVQQGLFQPAVIEDNSVTLLSENDEKPAGAVDDIFSELIEMNSEQGGEAVFLPDGYLEKFNGFAAALRY